MAGGTVSTGILPGEPNGGKTPGQMKYGPSGTSAYAKLSRHQKHLWHLKHLAAKQRKPKRLYKGQNKAEFTTLPVGKRPTGGNGKTGNTGPLPPGAPTNSDQRRRWDEAEMDPMRKKGRVVTRKIPSSVSVAAAQAKLKAMSRGIKK